MKRKDIVYLVIAAAVFALIGLLLYNHFSASKHTGGTAVEVIDPIPSSFDQAALSTLSDPSKVTNFQPQIPLTGLGNARPFGPLR